MAFDFDIDGLRVKFFDRSTFVASTWSWDFGDTHTSFLREPTHVYASAGDYDVVLTVTCGARTSEVTKTVNVTNIPAPPSLAVSLSTPWLFGSEHGQEYGVDVVTESPVAAIVSGGTGPYTYSWTADTGFSFATQGIWPSSPSGASTNFSAQLESPSTGFSNWLRAICTVTDSTGASVVSSPVLVFLTASFDTFEINLSTQWLLAIGTTTLVTSDSVTATVTGGSGNFTYQWNVETDDGRISADTPTAADTTISAAGLSMDESVLVGVNLTVTDTDTGLIVFSDWVQVILTANS
jgi:PKD repeat protein